MSKLFTLLTLLIALLLPAQLPIQAHSNPSLPTIQVEMEGNRWDVLPEQVQIIQQGYALAATLWPPMPVIQKVTIRYDSAYTICDYANKECLISLTDAGFYWGAYQLAHEVCHTRNAQVYDAYIEGLCGWFAVVLMKQLGYDIEGAHAYHYEYASPLYGYSYQMIYDLEGHWPGITNDLWNCINYATPQRGYVNTTLFLNRLQQTQPAIAPHVRHLLQAYADPLSAAVADDGNRVYFMRP